MLSYQPPIGEAELIGQGWLGAEYRIQLFEHPPAELQSRRVKYCFSLAVLPATADEAVLFVTSEHNLSPTGGSCVLGMFTEYGHEHHGVGDETEDKAGFVERALNLLSDRLAIPRQQMSLAE